MKQSRPLPGSNQSRDNRVDGAPQVRGPAGESPQASFKTSALVDAGAMPPKSKLKTSVPSLNVFNNQLLIHS